MKEEHERRENTMSDATCDTLQRRKKNRLVRNCRFWPLIREIKPDGNFGDIVFIRPAKVDETLAKKVWARGWYQGATNIAEDSLVGPFNFSNLGGETHRAGEDAWKTLENCEGVKSGRVDIDDLSQITPLI